MESTVIETKAKGTKTAKKGVDKWLAVGGERSVQNRRKQTDVEVSGCHMERSRGILEKLILS
jgi:hypothetical protein